MDSKIEILIQHGGEWDADQNFINFKVAGLLIEGSCSFSSFLSEIGAVIGVDAKIHAIDVKFSVKENYPPVNIYSDMSLKLYMQLKMKSPSIIELPLCVTIQENIEGSRSAKPNQISQSSEILMQLATINNKEPTSPSESEEDSDCYINDFESVHIINNPLHDDVCEGQLYQSKDVLKNVMKHYAIKKKIQFMVERSNKSRYYLQCVDDKCSWSLKASSLHKSNVFKVRKFNNVHVCGNNSRFFGQRNATSDLIGTLIKSKFNNPKIIYTPVDICADMKKFYGVEMSYMKGYRAREKALELLRGKPKDSYKKLPSYLYMLVQSNPGSVARLKTSTDGCFLYGYVALYGSIKGWDYCMPIVVVDGSFLKSPFRGTFLTACTQDAAGHIFPLAYAVVDSENNASWEWFFEKFRETYGSREGLCFVSDRHESILRATSIVYPEVPHCACTFHLWNNIKANFPKTQKQLGKFFYLASRAYTVEEFDANMAEIAKIDDKAREYLFNAGYEKWSRAHSTVNRTMVMTSNIAESMNSANKDAREMPIYNLMDYMTRLIEDWNYENRNEAMATFTPLPENYEEILKENFAASHCMTVKASTDYLFTVKHEEKRYVVSMREKQCTCRRFQMDGIPCSHALAIVRKYNMKEYEYCSAYHSTKYLKKTYEVPIYPIPDESSWNVPVEIAAQVVLAPKGRVKPGRPRKSRFKAPWEPNAKKMKTTCALCGQRGHNRRTCRNPTKIA